jgi:hypothetical protein
VPAREGANEVDGIRDISVADNAKGPRLQNAYGRRGGAESVSDLNR